VSIGIRLNPCVVLDWRDEVYISLFEARGDRPAAHEPRGDDPPQEGEPATRTPPKVWDDIPF